MKFRRVGPASLVGAIVTVVTVVVFVGSVLTGRMFERSKQSTLRLMQAVLANSLRSAEGKAVERAEIVVSMPSVREAFLKRDRAALANECARMFKIQDEKYGVNTAQFHTPPGVSFLRLHSPQQFGDDQSGYRPILADVSENKAIRKGLALSRSGPSVFGVVPILDDSGNYAGSFEIGLELAAVLNRMKEQFGIEVFALIDEKLLRSVASDLPPDVVASQNRRTGRFLRIHATRPSIADVLLTDRDVEVRDPVSYERRADGSLWSVQLVPMYDYGGKPIGVYAMAQDLTAVEAHARRVRIWQAASAVFAIAALTLVVFVTIRQLVLAPVEKLARQMSALASEDRSMPAKGAYCAELEVIATSYEALRHQQPRREDGGV